MTPELLIVFGIVLIVQLWAMCRTAKLYREIKQRLSEIKLDATARFHVVMKRLDAMVPTASLPARDGEFNSQAISETLNSDSYLTVEQVSEKLQISKAMIYSWAKSGRIPALRIRGSSHKTVWRFSDMEIEAWLKTQKHPVTTEKELFTKKGSDEAAIF